MAHIYKRSQKWAYSVHNANYLINGMKHKITKSGFQTKREAQLAANKVENSIDENTIIKESNITFKKFADKWLEYYSTQVKISSVDARKAARNILIKEWGAIPLRKITKQMYQSYIDKLNDIYSHNYIDSIHTTGNLIFSHAVRLDLLQTSPASGFIMPKKQMTVEDIENEDIKGEFLELDEFKVFLEIAKKIWIIYGLPSICYISIYRHAHRGTIIFEVVRFRY